MEPKDTQHDHKADSSETGKRPLNIAAHDIRLISLAFKVVFLLSRC